MSPCPRLPIGINPGVGGHAAIACPPFNRKKRGGRRTAIVCPPSQSTKREGGRIQKKSREGVAHCDRVSPFSMQERLAGHKVLVRLEDKPRDGARPVGKSCFRIFVAGPA